MKAVLCLQRARPVEHLGQLRMSLQGISDWLDPDLSTQISARQTRGLEEDPLVISLWVLGSLVLAQMLQAALPWPGSQEKPRLESDQMCGLVTTGQVDRATSNPT